ncbi:MAG: GTPase/DUF3482 domain-containing protein [Desulforhopalus sp.]
MIPEFAILGHPNEGKSSVLSTLAEDDSVRVSPIPGETTQCRTFPVIIDGHELLRFTDTPGFQNPGRVLSELRNRATASSNPLSHFRKFAKSIPELADDRELLGPVERGAGIIYVVDGSRPLRNVDRAEMEILRLTGKPRMAVINCKEDATQYLDDWKNEFRKNFNSYRVFNAHRATYAERILLLEALKSIDQDWHPVLSKVVQAFKQDWETRSNSTADIITGLLVDCLSLQLTENVTSEQGLEQYRTRLYKKYCDSLEKREKFAHQRIRGLFKHNIFNYELPPHSILHEELFNERTWQLLGLTQKQVVIAGALGGAAIGAGLDVAALGHGLGMFTAVGGVAGALGAIFGGENFSAKAKVMGIPLGGKEVQIGPARSINLLFIILNRSLLYYQHTINWAHGRRDYQKPGLVASGEPEKQGFTNSWPTSHIKICNDFFKGVQNNRKSVKSGEEEKFRQLILKTLMEISESE